MAEGSRWPQIVVQVAGGMTTRCRGSCPLTLFCDAFGRLCFDYPLAGCFPALPASVCQKDCPATAAGTKWLFRPGFLVGENEWLGRFVPGVVTPVRLHEHGVDLFEIDFGVECARLVDEAGFAFGIAAESVEPEGLAEQAQQVGPGVQRAVDDRRDPLLGIMADNGVLEDGLAGARLAEDDAKPALLAVDFQDVEVTLLMFEQRDILVDGEGLVADSEAASDHGSGVLWNAGC